MVSVYGVLKIISFGMVCVILSGFVLNLAIILVVCNVFRDIIYSPVSVSLLLKIQTVYKIPHQLYYVWDAGKPTI
jgi:hypothetical protein